MKRGVLPDFGDGGDISVKYTVILIAVAYIFSLLVRMIWVEWADAMDQFHWNGHLMINTNDGYFFASGVQKELYGMHAENPRVPSMWSYGTVAITALIVKLTSLPLETVILYMPAFVSSLVVIPIVLIGRLFGSTLWGFLAALLGAITWSYYNRTMTGYYDTDMFSAMAPMFILYFLIRSTVEFDLKNALYASLAISIYPFLYDQGRAIVFAMGIIYAIYTIWHHRDEKRAYISLILVFLALIPFRQSVPMEYLLHIVAVVVAYLLLRDEKRSMKELMVSSGVLFVLFLLMGNVFPLVWTKVAGYAFRGGESGGGLHFYNVSGTVREAGRIPFEIFAKRISGSIPAFILSIFGYLILLYRHRPFILSLPLVGIGAFALVGGLRFTVYAVPMAALSLTYLIMVVSSYIDRKAIASAVAFLLTAVAIWPNIDHVIRYKVPVVFEKREVEILDRLSHIGTDRDYVMTWWDYGYPIWFFAHKNTIIDGGKHHHDNFIVSEILTTDSQLESARLSRIAVEKYISSGYQVVADRIFANGEGGNLNPSDYLDRLKADDSVKIPKKSRDIYFYLPYRMLDIFPTVGIFSSMDLSTGKRYYKQYFYLMKRFKDDKETLWLEGGFALDKKRGILLHKNRGATEEIPLKRFVTVSFDAKGRQKTNIQRLDRTGDYSLIFYEPAKTFVLVNENTYNSFYIKLFLLGQYDPTLFELVENTPLAKIYRLKI